MNKKLSVAIIGAGQIAGGYDTNKINNDDGVYTHAGAYTKDGRFILRTVCDLDGERAHAFQKQWDITTATTNLADIYHSYHDVISVCTPNATHFEIISNIIKNKSAKTIFAEKPLALNLEDIKELMRLTGKNNSNIVVDFQRRFDDAFEQLRNKIANNEKRLLAVNVYYMKGLEHIGTTAIDTLTYLCGQPNYVYAYNRIFNKQVEEYTYEFILFYNNYNITVKTIDTEAKLYNYHIFEIDLLYEDSRVTVNDNSRNIDIKHICDYAYSGVKVLDDRNPKREETGYKYSMLKTVEYIYNITNNKLKHSRNTPESSYINKIILDAIPLSYTKNEKIKIGNI